MPTAPCYTAVRMCRPDTPLCATDTSSVVHPPTSTSTGGWGGTSDGYFLLDALDPDTQGAGGAASGAGFNYGQDITINFKPEAGGVGVPSFTAQGTGLLIEPGEFNIGREVTVTYDGGGFYNRSRCAKTHKIMLALKITGCLPHLLFIKGNVSKMGISSLCGQGKFPV